MEQLRRKKNVSPSRILLDAVYSQFIQNFLSKFLALFREDGYLSSSQEWEHYFCQEHFSEVFHS
jgi:hypothetical protein